MVPMESDSVRVLTFAPSSQLSINAAKPIPAGDYEIAPWPHWCSFSPIVRSYARLDDDAAALALTLALAQALQHRLQHWPKKRLT